MSDKPVVNKYLAGVGFGTEPSLSNIFPISTVILKRIKKRIDDFCPSCSFNDNDNLFMEKIKLAKDLFCLWNVSKKVNQHLPWICLSQLLSSFLGHKHLLWQVISASFNSRNSSSPWTIVFSGAQRTFTAFSATKVVISLFSWDILQLNRRWWCSLFEFLRTSVLSTSVSLPFLLKTELIRVIWGNE